MGGAKAFAGEESLPSDADLERMTKLADKAEELSIGWDKAKLNLSAAGAAAVDSRLNGPVGAISFPMGSVPLSPRPNKPAEASIHKPPSGKSFDEQIKDEAEAYKAQQEAVKESERVAKIAEQAETDRVQSINNIVAALRKEREELFMTSEELRNQTLFQAGATNAEIGQVWALERVINERKKQTAIEKEHREEVRRWATTAEQIYQSTRSPADKLREEWSVAREAVERGALGIGEYIQYINKTSEDFQQSLEASRRPNYAPIMELGSQKELPGTELRSKDSQSLAEFKKLQSEQVEVLKQIREELKGNKRIKDALN
jgi:hypothetical protein